MEEILSWVKSGLLFGIFSSVILMLCPNRAYVKHIGMVVGLLFLLIMLHPVMEFLELDGDTYAAYVKTYLMVENGDERISEKNLKLYEESVASQILALLQEQGYGIEGVSVNADEEGDVCEVVLQPGKELNALEQLEYYLKNLFGEELIICYENS